MAWARKPESLWVHLNGAFTLPNVYSTEGEGGEIIWHSAQFSPRWCDTASPEQRAEYGIVFFAEPAPPAVGYRRLSTVFIDNEDLPRFEIVDELIPPTVPARVPKLYAQLALKEFGLLATIENGFAELPVDDTNRLYWLGASHIERHSPRTINLGASFGIDDAGLDGLFIRAEELRIADGAI